MIQRFRNKTTGKNVLLLSYLHCFGKQTSYMMSYSQLQGRSVSLTEAFAFSMAVTGWKIRG